MQKDCRWIILVILIGCRLTGLHADDLKNTRITVYNENLGLIYQEKNLNLEKGLNILRIEGVSAQIRPTTVKLNFPKVTEKTAIMEQVFLYDLVSTAKIFEKYSGEKITFRLDNEESISGVLQHYDRNDVVVQLPDDGIRIVSTDNILDYEFPALPGGLITKPTLEWQIKSDFKGQTTAELSYLTSAMFWNAEYVLVLDQTEQEFDLSAWISLTNRSGASYREATLKLVAGGIHTVRDKPRFPQGEMMADAVTVTAEKSVESRALADYYIYEVGYPVTIKDNEIKQLSLFTEIRGKGQKIYLFENSANAEREEPLSIVFKIENTPANNMGIALPQGVIRLFKEDVDESLQFIGEDRIQHTSRKDTLRLKIGDAFDVKGEHRVIDRDRSAKRAETVTVEIRLTNRKNSPVNVEVIDHIYGYWEIKKASHEFRKESSQRVLFPITVKADATETINYIFYRKW
jgi:hypothetical protein